VLSIGARIAIMQLPPLLVLGRGVGVPTLVILMGAIGGMIGDGFIGLFVRSVMLAVGYKIAVVSLRSAEEVNSSAGLERLA
jgi:predicted PurR-regulated permease PerM